MSSQPSRRAFVGAALSLGGLLLTGCRAEFGGHSSLERLPLRSFGGYAPSDALHIAMVGDSLSVGIVEQLTGRSVSGAWQDEVDLGALMFLGGWSRVGATTGSLSDSVQPVAGADTLVIMAGTNDVAGGVAFDESRGSLDAVVDTMRPQRVSVAMIPPLSRSVAEANAYNADLKRLADDRGWRVTDPWRSVRDTSGDWDRQYRGDGTHPNSSGYQVAAAQLVDDLAEAYLGAEPIT